MIKGSHRYFWLEWVLGNLGFVDLNPQSRRGSGAHQPPFRLDRERFGANVLAPRHIVLHRLADNVTGRCKPELKRRRCGNGSLRVVRRDGDPVRLGKRGDTAGFRQTAAVRDVGLNHRTGAVLQQFTERMNPDKSLAGRNRRGHGALD